MRRSMNTNGWGFEANLAMAVINLFSKRQKKLRGDVPDVYVYDVLPDPLRVQVVHILHDAIGGPEYYENHHHSRHRMTYEGYKLMVDILCREYGTFHLPSTEPPLYGRDYLSELTDFLLKEPNTEMVLDAIELACRYIDKVVREKMGKEWADDALAELNTRFREHGVGYEHTDGELIRIDSQLLHAETVKPALQLLRDTPEYAGAQAEFLTAFEHYRHGRTKECLTESLKALESLMKGICTKRQWQLPAKATASALIQTLFDNGLVPTFWQQHFAALRSTLEAGVPTIRNKVGGHGQGVTVVEVPEHLASYTIHLTASAMVFLAAAENALS